MLFDINVSTGHWPFRHVPNQDIAGLKRILKGKGITGAAVFDINGLFYKNCHDANIELAKSIARHTDFFAGVAVLNPLYPAWEQDLEMCAGELGMSALRIAPQYHNYQLESPEAIAMVKKAAALKTPVFIAQTIVDPRGRHWMDTARAVGFNEVCALCGAVPAATVVFTGYVAPDALVDKRGRVRHPNLYLELSRLPSAGSRAIGDMIKKIGHKYFLFGSGAPLKEISPALLRLQTANISAAARRAVASGNAARILRRSG